MLLQIVNFSVQVFDERQNMHGKSIVLDSIGYRHGTVLQLALSLAWAFFDDLPILTLMPIMHEARIAAARRGAAPEAQAPIRVRVGVDTLKCLVHLPSSGPGINRIATER